MNAVDPILTKATELPRGWHYDGDIAVLREISWRLAEVGRRQI